MSKHVGVWVKLYLERQSVDSTMPEYVVGFLFEETPGAYVLSKVLETVETEDFDFEDMITEGINMISRTYVWRCEILGNEPVAMKHQSNPSGGLG